MKKGLDLSFGLGSQAWWSARKTAGYKVMVQDLYTGGDQTSEPFKTIAPLNLSRARQAGLIVCGYVNVAPWHFNDGSICVERGKAIAGAEWSHLKAVFVDVEIAAWQGNSITETAVHQAVNLVESYGKKTAIYSANWFWRGHLGNPTWPPWLKQVKLWNAYYDGDPDFDFDKAPYGPWALPDVMGEQFKGTTIIDGVAVDLNEFTDDFFATTEVPEPVPPPEEDDMAKLIQRKDGEELGGYYIVGTDGRKRGIKNDAELKALVKAEVIESLTPVRMTGKEINDIPNERANLQ